MKEQFKELETMLKIAGVYYTGRVLGQLENLQGSSIDLDALKIVHAFVKEVILALRAQ